MLAAALLHPECYPHPADRVELHETHISWVFLAGPYAYKVKKPVAAGFLDFSTLEARRRACEDELALNRSFAPDLYLEVVEIRGTLDAPRIGGEGPLLEHALKMRRFPQEALAGRLLERGALTPELVGEFARYLGRFHASLPPGDPNACYGSTETVLRNAVQNFDEIAPLLECDDDRDDLALLRDWTEREFLARYGELRERRAAGFVRECHGDLHLDNIVMLEGRLVPFDCIEFSARLRWNDVASEAAFLVMDLTERGADQLASVFLNAWLEATGWYTALAVLRFYLVYRAMVRAKVHLMRSRQATDPVEAARLVSAYRRFVALARRFTVRSRAALVLMHGYSGAGKSALAAALAPALGAIRIRADVERKRLKRLDPLARSGSGVESGIYDAGTTRATYERLAAAAHAVLDAGYPAIVDAACLKRWQRLLLAGLADALDVPVAIVEARAPAAVLRRRIARRAGDPSEATAQVLERQIATAEPIAPPELYPIVVVNTTVASVTGLADAVTARLRWTFSRPPLMQVKTPSHARGQHEPYDAMQFV